ncbi:Dabb family protein [Ulvibacterium marinum]|uniref:Dabb family protein n=1 Tax=Ulvibacterium marinum TaxID=2419782 RepID=A0A3B0C0U3_9FLAO|nr:Dabb family protein [Ulvibacterium marinum]RKN79283.1 Dabb family protein [Ulvibacterium marinum]
MKNVCLLFLVCLFNLGCQDFNKFHHVLLYKWSANATNEQKEMFLETFELLPYKIEGMKNVEIATIESSMRDYDLMVHVTFSSRTILEAYQNHPDHQRIVQMADDIILSYSYFQYSTN